VLVLVLELQKSQNIAWTLQTFTVSIMSLNLLSCVIVSWLNLCPRMGYLLRYWISYLFVRFFGQYRPCRKSSSPMNFEEQFLSPCPCHQISYLRPCPQTLNLVLDLVLVLQVPSVLDNNTAECHCFLVCRSQIMLLARTVMAPLSFDTAHT